MKIVNAPQKVTSSVVALAADVAAETSISGVNAWFGTELASPEHGAVLAKAAGPRFTVHRKQGHGLDIGLGECAILTDNSHYTKILAERWLKVWDGGGKGRLAHAIYAQATVVETTNGHVDVLTGLHTPAHVEGLWAKIPLPDRFKAKVLLRTSRGRVRTYIQVLHSWRQQTMALAAEFHADDVIAAPDGNLDAGKKWVCQLLARAWPGMNLAYTKEPDLGRRTVGWVLTTMTPGASHVVKAKASDHDAGVYSFTRVNQQPHKHQRPASPPPPFEHVVYNGALMDQKGKTAIQWLEANGLKDFAPLTILQGNYNPGGVAASAGTHDGGGVFDLAPFEFGKKIKIWRTNMGPGWHRVAIPGLWGEHCHVIINNHGTLSDGAKLQCVEYFEGLDGLADHARDPNQFHPAVGFSYEAAWHELHG